MGERFPHTNGGLPDEVFVWNRDESDTTAPISAAATTATLPGLRAVIPPMLEAELDHLEDAARVLSGLLQEDEDGNVGPVMTIVVDRYAYLDWLNDHGGA